LRDVSSDKEIADIEKRAQDFFNSATNSFGKTFSEVFSNPEFKVKNDVEKEYVEEMIANAKFFVIDMDEANKKFTQDDYDQDSQSARDRAENILKSLNTDTLDQLTENNNRSSILKNPADFLDRGFPGIQRKTVKLEITRTGVDNRFSSQRIFDIVANFRGSFSSDEFPALTEALDFFLDVWPQASETLYIDGNEIPSNAFQDLADSVGTSKVRESVNSSTFQNSAAFKNSTLVNDANKTLILDESGRLIDVDPETDVRFNEDLNDTGIPVARSDTIFRGRRFGGVNLSTGANPFPTIKLTTNNQTFELRDVIFASPIVFDIDGDGKLEASGGEWLPHKKAKSRIVQFDILGDGFKELTEWVGPNDGLLLVYKEGEEVTAQNLFGEYGGFFHGYEKLSLLDENNDKVLTENELDTLSIWQDENQNALADAGEVTSVKDLGITSINVTHERFTSTYVQNGETRKSWDWYPCIYRVKKKK